MELLHLQMRHPQYFTTHDSSLKSPLFWNNKHPKIGLSELLCTLEIFGSILTADGSKVSFTLIVKCFEEFLNVKLGDPQDIKRAVFRRKINMTKYLDALRHNLINNIDKIYR